MRLISLTVRNYRIHRDVTVDFDPFRNLIGGTNETGKSTLAEAIHRALFMRHRAGGDLQKSMVSGIHPGVPEVRLTFESADEIWTIEKQFAGTRGTARLHARSGISLQGDAAEDKLAEITANSEGMANRLNELTTRWAHLWVWQGTAGNDASTHAASRRDELVQRLQQNGLAAVMQSEADESAREKIRIAHEEMFTRNGSVKVNSRLDLASKALDEASQSLARAADQKQRLESAVMDQENAARMLGESMVALPAKREEHATVNASLKKANELMARHDREQLVLQNATDARGQMVKADRQIREFLRQADATREALVPAEKELSILAGQEAAAREAAATAELAHRATNDSVRLARQHHDLATACVSRFEKRALEEALVLKIGQIAAIEKSLAADREALARLPAVAVADVESLRKLEAGIGQAESALTAIAAGIELVSSDQAVLLDGQPLEAGTSRVITETSELTLGHGTLVRIRPGGGTSLAESRRNLEDLRQKLTAALDQLTVKNPADASEILTSRQDIQQRIASTESRLQALGARGLPDALAAATAELTAASTEVEHRLAALAPGQAPDLPESLDAARLWQANAREALQQAENQELALLAAADVCRKAHQEKTDAFHDLRVSLETSRKTLENHESSARILEQNHGDATQRGTALDAATAAETIARAAVDATVSTLADLNPDLLQQQVTRLTRVISMEEEKQRDAHTRLAVARNMLAQDGSSDPEAELLQAKARHASAAEECAREQRHADAIALLHRLFAESQSVISEGVTQPIADRVAGYLECLFGRGVRVGVDLTNPAQASIQITRPGTPSFAFDSLSGGAKEQVAAAVRLATAEILAASHDNCLPILFDDAFAYADDDRIQSLQTMLDLAASRGLQVLVFTCTPADYIGLGAKETRLSPPLWNSVASLPSDPAEPALLDSPLPGSPAALSVDAESAFLDALRRLGGNAGNLTLRNALGWDEAAYEAIKSTLISRNIIVPGRGRGGSVAIDFQS